MHDEFGKPYPYPGLVRSQGVSLGCGSLILIALIVMIFGNSNRGERANLAPVLQKLDAIERRLGEIERRMDQPKPSEAK